MKTILKQLVDLSDAELYSLSDAVDAELDRLSESGDEFADSARRRAVEARAELSPTRWFLGAAGEGRRFRQVAQSARARPESTCANSMSP